MLKAISAAGAVVALLATMAASSALMGRSGAPLPWGPVTSLTFGAAWKYNSGYPPKTVIGDGWGNTWADDDQIYTMHNDTSIWNDITSHNTNVKVSTLSSSATDGSAVGTLVSNMDKWGTITQNTGSPARSHKVNSVIAIGATFYGLSWRLDPNWMTTVGTWDGQLIKSVDHGVTWTPEPPSNGAPYSTAAMWPGTTFPFGWVQYGKAYAGSGPHGSGTYVYSTIIVGADQAKLKLARVPLATIANLNVADWQYWTGGDGMNPANWSSTFAAAANVFDLGAADVGLSSGMQYLPRYDRYLYVGSGASGFIAYICTTPWSCNPNAIATTPGYNMPAIMPKSLVNGGQQLVMTASGDSADYASPTGRYTLYYVPMTLTP